MLSFATLDDSLVYHKGIYVYTHALINAGEQPEVLIITGGRKDIYDEKKILAFIQETLFEEKHRV